MNYEYKCPGCGCADEPYFSRVQPMGYYCPKCGCPESIEEESFIKQWW